MYDSRCVKCEVKARIYDNSKTKPLLRALEHRVSKRLRSRLTALAKSRSNEASLRRRWWWHVIKVLEVGGCDAHRLASAGEHIGKYSLCSSLRTSGTWYSCSLGWSDSHPQQMWSLRKEPQNCHIPSLFLLSARLAAHEQAPSCKFKYKQQWWKQFESWNLKNTQSETSSTKLWCARDTRAAMIQVTPQSSTLLATTFHWFRLHSCFPTGCQELN